MSSKWKYANLDSKHRIELLKKGNKDVFDEEVARTKEVVKARRELGLDTTEQEKWMDTVGYSYAQSMADEGQRVSESGYAKLYLEDKTPDTEPSPIKSYKESAPVKTSYISNAKSKIKRAGELAKQSMTAKYESIKKDVANEIYARYPNLKETVLNSGGNPEGGKMLKMRQALEDVLNERYAKLDGELAEKIKDIEKRYAGYIDEIIEYRRNGTALESLGVIADVLIKNAALKDGYSYSDITGFGGKSKIRTPEKEEDTETDDTYDIYDTYDTHDTIEKSVGAATEEALKKAAYEKEKDESGKSTDDTSEKTNIVSEESDTDENVYGDFASENISDDKGTSEIVQTDNIAVLLEAMLKKGMSTEEIMDVLLKLSEKSRDN